MVEKTSLTKIKSYVKKQKAFFDSQETKSYDFRKRQLKILYKAIKDNEEALIEALRLDLGKHENEAYMTEIGMVYYSISHTLKHLKSWMGKKKVKTPLFLQPGNSYLYPKPLGNTLIIAPFNYPFYLLIEPLVGAIAAGNTAILRPANQTENFSKLINQIIADNFDPEYIACTSGGHETITKLLAQKYDLIFFTGGEVVGKVVMEAASKNLTPVVLELGGKSPVIVDDSADLDLAAKRIVWGKYLNTGQTCVACDYVFVHESKKKELLKKMEEVIIKFYGENQEESQSLGRIINDKNMQKLVDIIETDKKYLYYGGNYDLESRYFQPSILSLNNPKAKAMEQEIFGPILPVISYLKLDEPINYINAHAKPLAFYIFSENQRNIDRIMAETISGGACINDVIEHLTNHHLPFGGVGESGMGSYHGFKSFETFSHMQPVLEKKENFLADIISPPYKKSQLSLLKKYFK